MSGFAKYLLIGYGQNAGLNGDGQDNPNNKSNGADAADNACNCRQAKKRPEIGSDRLNAFSGGWTEIHLFVHNQIDAEHQKSLGSVYEKKRKQLPDNREKRQDR